MFGTTQVPPRRPKKPSNFPSSEKNKHGKHCPPSDRRGQQWNCHRFESKTEFGCLHHAINYGLAPAGSTLQGSVRVYIIKTQMQKSTARKAYVASEGCRCIRDAAGLKRTLFLHLLVLVLLSAVAVCRHTLFPHCLENKKIPVHHPTILRFNFFPQPVFLLKIYSLDKKASTLYYKRTCHQQTKSLNWDKRRRRGTEASVCFSVLAWWSAPSQRGDSSLREQRRHLRGTKETIESI